MKLSILTAFFAAYSSISFAWECKFPIRSSQTTSQIPGVQQMAKQTRLILDENAAEFKQCRDDIAPQVKEDKLSMADISETPILISVRKDGTVSARCSCEDVVSKSDSIKEVRAKLKLANCYVSKIEKVKLPGEVKAVENACWDGKLPILPDSGNATGSAQKADALR